MHTVVVFFPPAGTSMAKGQSSTSRLAKRGIPSETSRIKDKYPFQRKRRTSKAFHHRRWPLPNLEVRMLGHVLRNFCFGPSTSDFDLNFNLLGRESSPESPSHFNNPRRSHRQHIARRQANMLHLADLAAFTTRHLTRHPHDIARQPSAPEYPAPGIISLDHGIREALLRTPGISPTSPHTPHPSRWHPCATTYRWPV